MDTPVLMDETIHVSKTTDDVKVIVVHKIIDKVTRKEKVTRLTLEINQIALTEIKQYANPPEGVHECIMATLVLLGDQPEDCKVRIVPTYLVVRNLRSSVHINFK